MLTAILIYSVVLNWLQHKQTDRLIEQIEEMEYFQSELSSKMEELDSIAETYEQEW